GEDRNLVLQPIGAAIAVLAMIGDRIHLRRPARYRLGLGGKGRLRIIGHGQASVTGWFSPPPRGLIHRVTPTSQAFASSSVPTPARIGCSLPCLRPPFPEGFSLAGSCIQ